jgi:hypothetical protein
MTAKKKVAAKKDPIPTTDVGLSEDLAAGLDAAVGAIGLLQNLISTAQGASGDLGQVAGLGASDTQHKTDVNVPEVLTGFNAMTQGRGGRYESAMDLILAHGIANLEMVNNTVNNQTAKFATLMDQMAIDHRDQNHDRQINLNETDAYGTLALAAMAERLRNPTPIT